MVATPLSRPMGWNNSSPLFCTATETLVDITNESLHSHQPRKPHKLDNVAEEIAPPPETPLAQKHTQLTWDP